MTAFEIRFDDLLINPGFQTGLQFTKPSQLFAPTTEQEFHRDLAILKSKDIESHWLAGFVSYEAGYYLEEKLNSLIPKERKLPLFCIGVFDSPIEFKEKKKFPDKIPKIDSFEFGMDLPEYELSVSKLKKFITDGDTYQINLSFPCNFDYIDNPYELYLYLLTRQKVSYASYIEYSNMQILSVSPELFIQKQGNALICKPMKGTAKRHPIPEIDDWIKNALLHSSKNQAENLMITDLIRNDLGRFATIGSVQTSEMFRVESFDTVHQMTSTVTAIMDPKFHFLDVLTGMFPCGSITGAPKMRSMEIIQEIEKSPRGIYTGTIGYLPPRQSRLPSIWNIAIRTIVIQDKKAQMGIGSGIVMDSDYQDEFNECLAKANFLTSSFSEPVEFGILESIPIISGKLRNKLLHIDRLKKSAKYWGIDFDLSALAKTIESSLSNIDGFDIEQTGRTKQNRYRLRIALSESGEFKTSIHKVERSKTNKTDPIDPTIYTKRIRLSKTRLDSNNPYLYHKTSFRNLYDLEYSNREEYYDIVFCNERGEITESCTQNIFVKQNGIYFTPPVTTGLLAGILRKTCLEKFPRHFQEKVLYLEDLLNCERIVLGNSVRGFTEVVFETIE
ncbi:aminodeoxychorismate synthase component I [Leptospira sp. GIMC2001]|uniref:aminodeoxychorismate synthase component I n=1 Tax=Leptospira sp. GIMC2001 TaxID=1513297 RepID=UPI00234B84FC|nr:aminodeoxychorismate synthase component I [Leptospira sp. GIMC2001]WCL50601.1 aminodeoxychorismate synthase component I [Leptospira sp. GIMC2001]